MTRPSPHYPGWVAMGAAVVGTVLGALSVWLGLHAPDVPLAGAGRIGAGAPAVTEPSAPRAAAAPPAEPVAAPPSEGSALAEAVERTMPSVVSIRLARDVRGAGVVYDARGLLLTNYHVVAPVLRGPSLGAPEADGDGLTVQFANGRELPARVVAADGDEDIAVLRLMPADNAERFAPAALGSSAALRVGDSVFAIGSPVGLQHTVSTGIVSALGRTDVLPKRQLPLIQLDAAINVGNSGGPLFDMGGRLVGITAARSRAQGIGFAIPIDHVSAVLRVLQQGDEKRSGVIGIELSTGADDSEMWTLTRAALEGTDYTVGLMVSRVDAGPARDAGMLPGDVLVEIRGKRYDGMGPEAEGREAFLRHFGQVVRSVVPGERLALTVVRDHRTVPLEIAVAAASDARQARIDCEEMLGLVLDEEGEDGIVARIVPGSEVSRFRDARERLVGAQISHVLGRKVGNLDDLGEILGDIRSWSRAGHGRTISITFRHVRAGAFTVDNFPVGSPQ